MRFDSDSGDFLEIECRRAEVDAYDLRLLVRVRFCGFAGEIGTWVLRAAWLDFVRELSVLEARRQGAARLDGMSPEDFSIVVRSIDHAGHMAVEGRVGARGHRYAVSLQLGLLEFDPSRLPALVHAARTLAALN